MAYTYEDPETGDLIDVIDADDDDDDDDDELRNARPRRRSPRSRGRGRSRGRRYSRPSRRYTPPRRSQAPARTESRAPAVVREQAPKGEYFSVKKGAIAEIMPAVGKVWASFLGTPNMPRATGNDIADRDNASAHRDSLAKHQQNQTRILALTELAGRALTLFTS